MIYFTGVVHHMDNMKQETVNPDFFIVDFNNPVFVGPEDGAAGRIGRLYWEY